MSKGDRMKKRTLSLALVGLMLSTLLVGCDSQQAESMSALSEPIVSSEIKQSEVLTSEDVKTQINFANSTPENDTDIGLKTIRIDSTEVELSEEQKTVIQYYDDDYLYINYEFARRYPIVFQDAQVSISGTVSKVLSQDASHYELILWVGYDADELICIRGETSNAMLMEGDQIAVHGCYADIETMEIDGHTLTIPVIDVYDTYYTEYRGESQHRFDIGFIKDVAEAVFGDVDVRKFNSEEKEKFVGYWTTNDYLVEQYYVVELENQGNSKLSKFYINSDGGEIADESIFSTRMDLPFVVSSSIFRFIEFTSDLQHFYIISYNFDLQTYEIEYYDHHFNKIWEREFEEVEISSIDRLMDKVYDYTKNNFYVVINNELYVLNAATGEDVFPPIYVGGNKVGIRKLSDGILLIGWGKSDAIMKIDLKGQMIWKNNVSEEVVSVESIQAIGNNLIISVRAYDSQGRINYHYYVVDNETGAIIVDAVELQ